MGEKAQEVERLYTEAVARADEERRLLEEEKDTFLEERVAASARETEQAEEVARLAARVEELSGADVLMAEAEAARAEADAATERADKRAATLAQRTEEVEAVAAAFEQRVKGEADRAAAENARRTEALRRQLREEEDRNERAEARLGGCIEQLKEVQRREDADREARRRLEERVGSLQAALRDARVDTKHSKQNAKSVGWILAGRGSLLRDLYRLHSSLKPGPARELSTHILDTHLFECERRNLGLPIGVVAAAEKMSCAEGNVSVTGVPGATAHSSPPRAPSPRESARLLGHSPAARFQVSPPPPPPDKKQKKPTTRNTGAPRQR